MNQSKPSDPVYRRKLWLNRAFGFSLALFLGILFAIVDHNPGLCLILLLFWVGSVQGFLFLLLNS